MASAWVQSQPFTGKAIPLFLVFRGWLRVVPVFLARILVGDGHHAFPDPNERAALTSTKQSKGNFP